MSFYTKNFSRLRRDIPIFVIILFDPHQKIHHVFHWPFTCYLQKNFQVFFKKKLSIFFTCFLCNFYMTSKHWPRLLPGLWPFIKNFSRLRRDIPIFVIILFDPHQKIHHVFHWPFTCYSQKTLKYFFKKNLSIFFTCFLCHFYMTSKHWPRLLPGLCPFIKKNFFPPSAGHPYFCYYTFWPPSKNPPCISLTFHLLLTKKLSSIF